MVKYLNNMDKINVVLEVETVLTLSGKKSFYRLPDSAYGEWIIFENKLPKYYLNVFDEDYHEFLRTFEKIKDKDEYLEEIIKKINQSLSIRNSISGIRFFGKPKVLSFTLEKLPPSFLL